MNCQEARPLIAKFVDQELSTPEDSSFYQHLSACPHCRREVSLAREASRLLALACTHLEPPEQLSGRIMEAVGFRLQKNLPSRQRPVSEEARRGFWRRGKRKLSSAAAAALLCLATGLGFMFNSSGFVRPLMLRAEVAMDKGRLALNNASEAARGVNLPTSPAEREGVDRAAIQNNGSGLHPGPAPEKGNIRVVPPSNGDSGASSSIPEEFSGTGQKGSAGLQEQVGPQEHTRLIPEEQNSQVQQGGQLVPLEVGGGVYLIPLVLDEKETISRPKWSPDGKEIWYLVSGSGGEEGFSIPAGGGAKTPLNRSQLATLQDSGAQAFSGKMLPEVPKEAESVAWSEQGRAAYLLGEQVFTVAADGKKVAVLRGVKSSRVTLAWAPGGDLLAVNVGPPPAGEESREGVWVLGPEGQNLRRLSKTGGGNTTLWAPDKQKIAFNNTAGTYYVAFLGRDARSGRVEQITPQGGYGPRDALAWSPDSQSLALIWGQGIKERGLWLVKFQSTAY